MICELAKCRRAQGRPAVPTWMSPASTTSSAGTGGGVQSWNSRCRSERTRILTEDSARGLVSAVARQLASHRQLMHGLRALVGDHALEIEHVADRSELGTDSGGAEHVAAIARHVERHAAVVPLGQRYLHRL